MHNNNNAIKTIISLMSMIYKSGFGVLFILELAHEKLGVLGVPKTLIPIFPLKFSQ